MHRIYRAILLLLTLACLWGAVACHEEKQETEDSQSMPQAMSLQELTLSEYVELGAYRDLQISLGAPDASRGEAVWQAVIQNCRILRYPEEQVAYYAEQSRARYRYYAKQKEATYEEILAANGVTEEDILQEARELTAKDLILYALLEAEQVTLTEEDKSAYFARYAEKFVTEYGYSEEYVQTYLKEEIYDTMLYDKMTERLIMLNSFSVLDT